MGLKFDEIEEMIEVLSMENNSNSKTFDSWFDLLCFSKFRIRLFTNMTEESDTPQESTDQEKEVSEQASADKKGNCMGLDLVHKRVMCYYKTASQKWRAPYLDAHNCGLSEDGILAGILPGNSRMLHFDEAITTSASKIG